MPRDDDTAQTFQQDCIELLRERTENTTWRRRDFLRVAAALGVAPAAFTLVPVSAARAADEIVLVNWGGDAIKAFTESFAEPYNAAGIGPKAVVVGEGPSSGKIRAMVESKKVTWDLCDRNMEAALQLGREGFLEELDYGVIDKAKVRPGHHAPWGIANYIYSHPITWDRKALGDKVPRTWADFWNVKDFPGKRTIRKHIDGMLEPALIADGVAPDKLYPLDVDRALAKIREIKPHTIFWASGAESQQLFREGEVVMGCLWHTRSSVLKRESEGRIDFHFNQAVLFPGAWIVPKGNPAGAAVMKLIASSQDPKQQVRLLEMLGNGPANPAAAPLIPDALKPYDPSTPANFDIQVQGDMEWYAANSRDVLNRYIDVVSS